MEVNWLSLALPGLAGRLRNAAARYVEGVFAKNKADESSGASAAADNATRFDQRARNGTGVRPATRDPRKNNLLSERRIAGVVVYKCERFALGGRAGGRARTLGGDNGGFGEALSSLTVAVAMNR